MKCVVYKGRNKADTYLYVEKQDALERVPAELRAMLGELDLVMELELSPERKLAQADAELVRSQLRERGFYLQMPPSDVAAREAVEAALKKLSDGG